MSANSQDLKFLVKDTLDKNKQAIVFVPSKRSAEAAAERFSKKFKDKTGKYALISNNIRKALSTPTKQCERLSFCANNGFAFHHSGLVSKQRHIIENSFRNNGIKIIFCTPTLALGVDLPAFRTIITSLKRYGGEGYNWIPVMEYLQMAGRAGRKGKEDYGESIVLSRTEVEREKIIERFLHADPEPVYSKLAVEPVLRTYLLSLISMNVVNTRNTVMSFFEKTFFAHQYMNINRLHGLMDKQIELLEKYGFIEVIKKKETYSMFESAANILMKKKPKEDISENYKATPLGELVSKLYLDPVSANHIIQSLGKAREHLVYLKNNPFTLIQSLAGIIEMKPLFRVGAKDEVNTEQLIIMYNSRFLVNVPDPFDIEYPDFLKSLKFSKVIFDWISEADESLMLENYSIRPGELKAKLDTFDWILYSSSELSKQLNYRDLIPAIAKLRVRLSYGAKEELLNLLRLKGVGRKRARVLFSNGFKNTSLIMTDSFPVISRLVGSAIALKIFKQLGYDVSGFDKEVKKKKVNSSSLLDY